MLPAFFLPAFASGRLNLKKKARAYSCHHSKVLTKTEQLCIEWGHELLHALFMPEFEITPFNRNSLILMSYRKTLILFELLYKICKRKYVLENEWFCRQ